MTSDFLMSAREGGEASQMLACIGEGSMVSDLHLEGVLLNVFRFKTVVEVIQTHLKNDVCDVRGVGEFGNVFARLINSVPPVTDDVRFRHQLVQV